VPLGVSDGFQPLPRDRARSLVAGHHGLAQPYLLHLGTLEPRKNLPLLIDACAPLWHGGSLTHRLVLAGAPGWGAAAVEQAIARHGVARWVVRPGTVPDSHLPALYRAADAVLLPSLGEGFGLPLLEAMACGVPVIAADAGALPEVAGDAGLLVDPRDPPAWAAAIARLLADQDLAARLRLAGPARAAEFTWERCARETLAVYREAVG
jgi:glycosyltransferase involved in cell wall biosynthesis